MPHPTQCIGHLRKQIPGFGGAGWILEESMVLAQLATFPGGLMWWTLYKERRLDSGPDILGFVLSD